MAQDLAYSYASILKSEKQDDGTLKVYGKATDDSIDIDQQICDDTWLQKAMPDWFTTGGNIREQHSNIAAGVATEYEAKSDGHYITALVVDRDSVKKVEAGVLKGFSIGIRGPRVVRDAKAAGGRIIDGQIIEISLVDRPANPNAKLMLAKAAADGTLEKVAPLEIPKPSALAKNSNTAEPTATLEEPTEGTTMPEETVATEEVVVEEVATEEVAAEETPVEETPAEEPATEEVATEEVAEEAPAEVEIIEAAKSLIGTLNKFDAVKYESAVNAIADLIVVEAEEMKAGHDERHSIKELLRAAKHLARWYEGEVEEGEVPDALPVAEDIYMSADAEDCGCAGDDDCECADDKMCKCNMAAKSASVTVDDEQVSAIITKAVDSAKAAVTDEIETLKTALEAESAKAIQLAEELAVAKKAAVAGGPKRSTISKSVQDVNELLIKATEYRVKAANTNDKELAEGYRELAADLEAKSRKDIA